VTEHPIIVVVGAGGHAIVVADILLAAGERVAGFIDERREPGELVLGLPVLGPFEWCRGRKVHAALGLGDNRKREESMERCQAFGATILRAIHPRAVVSASATLGEGVAVMALAVINPNARVGEGAIINTAAVVEHDCVVGSFAHVSPNAALAGGCHIGRYAQLGIGASMLPGKKVGESAVVGGGAVVISDIPDAAIAVGVPARVLTKT
jgi:sugar O-acyltransferase (sialic acid O-acetyltransferase NeuD family)